MAMPLQGRLLPFWQEAGAYITTLRKLGYPGTYSYANGAVGGSYGGQFYSTNDALKVDPPATANGRAQRWIVGTDPHLFAVDIDPGALYVNGDLTVTGAKTGFVVDAMQNVGDSALEPGDVVVIVDKSSFRAGRDSCGYCEEGNFGL